MVNLTSASLQLTSNDWEAQCRQGRELANALIELMIQNENPLLFGQALAHLHSGAESNGVKTGLMARLAEKLMASQV